MKNALGKKLVSLLLALTVIIGGGFVPGISQEVNAADTYNTMYFEMTPILANNIQNLNDMNDKGQVTGTTKDGKGVLYLDGKVEIFSNSLDQINNAGMIRCGTKIYSSTGGKDYSLPENGGFRSLNSMNNHGEILATKEIKMPDNKNSIYETHIISGNDSFKVTQGASLGCINDSKDVALDGFGYFDWNSEYHYHSTRIPLYNGSTEYINNNRVVAGSLYAPGADSYAVVWKNNIVRNYGPGWCRGLNDNNMLLVYSADGRGSLLIDINSNKTYSITQSLIKYYGFGTITPYAINNKNQILIYCHADKAKGYHILTPGNPPDNDKKSDSILGVYPSDQVLSARQGEDIEVKAEVLDPEYLEFNEDIFIKNEIISGEISIKSGQRYRFKVPIDKPNGIYSIEYSYQSKKAQDEKTSTFRTKRYVYVSNGQLNGQIAIAGKVFDKESGSPIEGVRINCQGSIAETDANGNYALTDVSSGERELLAGKDGYWSQQLFINVPNEGAMVYNIPMESVVPGSDLPEVTYLTYSIGSEITYIHGVDREEMFSALVDWKAHSPGSYEFIIESSLYPSGTKTIQTSDPWCSINVGKDIGVGGRLKVIAVSSDGVCSKPVYANIKVIGAADKKLLDEESDLDYNEKDDTYEDKGTTSQDGKSEVKLINNVKQTDVIPDSVPLLGGSAFKIGIGGYAYKVEYKDGKRIISFDGRDTDVVTGVGNLTTSPIKASITGKLVYTWDGAKEKWILSENKAVFKLKKYKEEVFKRYWVVPNLFIPVYLEGTLQCDGMEVGIGNKIENNQLVFSGDIKITPSFEVASGVGIDDVLGGEIWGKGKLTLNITQPSMTGTFSAGWRVFAASLMAEGEWLNKDIWTYEPQNAPLAIPDLSTANGETISRDYLNNNSLWNNVLNSPRTMNEESRQEIVLQSNIYPYAEPEIAKIGDGIGAVWLADDTNRSDLDRTYVAWSHGNQWAEPAAIWNDGTADFKPSLTESGNDLIVAWENMNAPLTQTGTGFKEQLNNMYAKSEIAVANFDSETNEWENAINLTNDSYIDRSPIVSGIQDNAIVVWIKNKGNDYLGSTENMNDIMFSKWDGTSWSQEAVAKSSERAITKTSFSYNGTKGVYAFVVDEDGDSATINDQSIYMMTYQDDVWSVPTKVTTHSLQDTNPQIKMLGNDWILVWSEDGKVVYKRGSDINKTITIFEKDQGIKEFKLVSDENGKMAIVWHAQKENGIQLYASIYQSFQRQFSKPFQLTDDETFKMYVSPSFDANGQLHTIFTRAQIIERDINGAKIKDRGETALCITSLNEGTDIKVDEESIEVDGNAVAPGKPVFIKARVKNAGEKPVEGVKVNFYHGDPENGGSLITSKEIGGIIQPGETDLIGCLWFPPNEFKSCDIYVVVNPDQTITERDYTNNSTSKKLIMPDLKISKIRAVPYGNDKMLVTVEVRNTDFALSTDSMLTLRKNNAQGEVLGVQNVPSIKGLGRQDITFEINTQNKGIQSDTLELYAVIESQGNEESNQMNNESYAAIQLERVKYNVTKLDFEAIDINNSGDVVGNKEQTIVLWKDASIYHVAQGNAKAINNQGDIAAVIKDRESNEDVASLIKIDGSILYQESALSNVNSVNDSGKMAGDVSGSEGYNQAAIWNKLENGYEKAVIGEEFPTKSTVVDINNQGVAVATYSTDTQNVLVMWLNDTEKRTLDTSENLQVNAVNMANIVAGRRDTEDGLKATLWTSSGRKTLLDHGNALDINNYGKASGYVTDSDQYKRAVLWDLNNNNQRIELNKLIARSEGIELLEAIKVNDKGQILCLGETKSGEQGYYLLTPNFGYEAVKIDFDAVEMDENSEIAGQNQNKIVLWKEGQVQELLEGQLIDKNNDSQILYKDANGALVFYDMATEQSAELYANVISAAMNDQGTIVALVRDNDNHKNLIWKMTEGQSEVSEIKINSRYPLIPVKVNNEGTIAGYYDTSGEGHMIRMMVIIKEGVCDESYIMGVRDMNENGTVAGSQDYFKVGDDENWLKPSIYGKQKVPEYLDEYFNGGAYSVNEEEIIVGNVITPVMDGSIKFASLWDEQGHLYFLDEFLKTEGIRLNGKATKINNKGEILCEAVNEDGTKTYYLLVPKFYDKEQQLNLPWEAGKTYGQGDIVTYAGALYQCRQSHMSEETTAPTAATNLWSKDLGLVEKTWAPDTAFETGQMVSYQGAQYECIQGHTSMVGWEPDKIPSLWQRIVSQNSEWSLGVSYKANDVVYFQGKQYICITGHTAQQGWEPPNVPALWQLSQN